MADWERLACRHISGAVEGLKHSRWNVPVQERRTTVCIFLGEEAQYSKAYSQSRAAGNLSRSAVLFSEGEFLLCVFSPLAVPSRERVSNRGEDMATPFMIRKRPFAVEPITGLMLPDGIFDTCITRLLISVYLVNDSKHTVRGFWARIADTPDYTVLGLREHQVNRELASGAATLLQWEATFAGAQPGKKTLQIEAGGMSVLESGKPLYWDGYCDARYFLSSTSYDGTSKTYLCKVPEGSLAITFDNSEQSLETTKPGDEGKLPPVQFPQRLTATVLPNGLSLPFEDPWWKVVGWLVALLAGIGALLEASKGHGSAQIGIGGHGHDNPADFEWCIPDPTAFGEGNYATPAGILSAIANGAMLVGLADDADPWERGRTAANLLTGEVPVRETVSVDLTYPPAMEAGTPFPVGAKWTYDAVLSTGRATSLTVNETRTNVHLATWEMQAPAEAAQFDPIIVRLRGQDAQGTFYKGDELYAYAIAVAPDGKNSFRIPLLDDGANRDAIASDGWYTGVILIEELMAQAKFDPLGEWKVHFVVQDVNGASPSMPPKEAATYIGGVPLLAPLIATRANGESCTVNKYIKIIIKKFL